MKLAYYPGCTLKTKAANLERGALAALETLGVAFQEMPRWNCCGAVFSLATDDLIHHMAPVRDLIRARELGADAVVTLCSQCYNTLARANLLMRSDEEKRNTINAFMDEEPDYHGELQVLHYLAAVRDLVGWEELRAKVVKPLTGLKVAPFYGCTLVRPGEVAVDGPHPELFEQFLRALGAEPVAWSGATECCGSYQSLAHPEASGDRASVVLAAAVRAGADLIALSCPLCEFNLGMRQADVVAGHEGAHAIPTLYFSQLLAVALGLEPDLARLELSDPSARQLLTSRNLIAAVAS
jgi:heterodisulfide reductase subunit B2